MATPYDGKIGLWHVAGSWVGEADIEALAQTVRRFAPTADAIYVKSSQGARWQGASDSKKSMAVEDTGDISRWVQTLARYNLELHLWAVPTGADPDGEADRIIEACRVPGVRSMILDVEPFDGFYKGTREDIQRTMARVRQVVPRPFHIGMSVDPRRRWYQAINPDAWRPYVDSIHPQVYWAFMGREADDVLTETYVVWGDYGLPIFPVLQGFDVSGDAIREAQDIARGVRGAAGLSYFRLGTLGPVQFAAINEEKVAEAIGPDDVVRTYGWERIITPGGRGYRDGSQTGQPVDQLLREATDTRGQIYRYKNTEAQQDTVFAQWVPNLPQQGLYEVSVFVPARHASTTHAEYHIHGIIGRGTELLVRFNQSLYRSQWVPLVVFEFQAGIEGGRVNLTDLTGEVGREIAFTAVRWRQVLEQKKKEVEEQANQNNVGFDSPVGTADERTGDKIWPGDWFESVKFAEYYTTVGPAFHTGSDLNLNRPRFDADRGAPVYAVSGGVVTFSAVVPRTTWGHLVIIRHDPLPDGRVVWSRSAHLDKPLVKEGDRVERGQQIASVGNAGGRLSYHLHFDIAVTDIMERNPGHWPATNQDALRRNYVDPKAFIQANRPPRR